MLGDRYAAGRNHESGGGRDVVSAGAITAGAAGVDGSGRSAYPHHALAQHGGAGCDLVDGFAAHPKPHQEGAHLSRGRIARHHDRKGFARRGEIESFAFGHDRQDFLEALQIGTHAGTVCVQRAMKLRNKRFPTLVSMLSGWN